MPPIILESITWTGNVANTTNRQEAKALFGFTARNSSVVWSAQSYTNGSARLATVYDGGVTITGANHSSNSP
jgi:hypothetical protein